MAALLILPSAVRGQGSLPDPPEGFTWQSQGVMVYTDSGAFTVDLGHNGVPGTPGAAVLDETISLTTYDATPFTSQHVLVHSSTYSVTLDGLGSAVVVNLGGAPADFSGNVAFADWSIGGDASVLPETDQILNPQFQLGPGSGSLFEDGGGQTSLAISLESGGSAPTDGTTMDFDYAGLSWVELSSTTVDGLWFASGSARGNASLQTVYERFDLVAIPEPSVLLLLVGGGLIALRRRRA